MAQLVRRAMDAGYTALVVTGDRPVLGRREADIHNCYELAPRLSQARVMSATGARIGPLPDGTYDLVSTHPPHTMQRLMNPSGLTRVLWPYQREIRKGALLIVYSIYNMLQ